MDTIPLNSDTIFSTIPNLTLYVTVVSMAASYVVETLKVAIEKKDYISLSKRLFVLVFASVIASFSSISIAGLSPVVSKIISVLVISSFSCDGVYPTIKRLKNITNERG